MMLRVASRETRGLNLQVSNPSDPTDADKEPGPCSKQTVKLQQEYLHSLGTKYFYVLRVKFHNFQQAFQRKLLTSVGKDKFETSEAFCLASDAQGYDIDVTIHWLSVIRECHYEPEPRVFTFYHINDPIQSKVRDVVLRHLNGPHPPGSFALFYVDLDKAAMLCWLCRKTGRSDPIAFQVMTTDLPEGNMLVANQDTSPLLVSWLCFVIVGEESTVAALLLLF